MTLKQRYDIRKALIKNYTEKAATCWRMAAKLSLKDISAEFVVGINPRPCVCFLKAKPYQISDVCDAIDVIMPMTICCEHFGKDVCPESKCPYRAKYQEYKNQEKLLIRAKEEKRIAFKRIFQHIK